MSYSVEFATKNAIEPEKVFQKIADHGKRIVVVSGDFPSLKFGLMDSALRGIEVNQTKEGYEVRVMTCSSVTDYELFPVAIDAMSALTGAEPIAEDEIAIDNPYETYGKKWVDAQMNSSRKMLCAMVRDSGTEVVMSGLFFPFCIGINILHEFGVELQKPNKKSFGELLDYFVHIQWNFHAAETTQSRLCVKNPNDDGDRPLGISLISIENSRLNDFEIVTYDDLVGFVDMDRDETVLIRFKDFGKTILNKKFSRIDECQYRVIGELNVDDVRNMMNLAKRFKPDDLFYSPSFPGSGYDDRQNTFVLMWNPSFSSVTENGFEESMFEMFEGWFNWSVFEWEKAKMGDRFYLVRVGESDSNGVVMAGVFGSRPYRSEDWSGKKRIVYYTDLYPNVVANPKIAPIMTTAELEKAVPDYQWRKGHSGMMLDVAQAQALEVAFSTCLSNFEKIMDENDAMIRHSV